MSLRFWCKYTLPRLLRFRPTPFEALLCLGVLAFLGGLGWIVWGMLPSSSLGRYDASVRSALRAAEHFPQGRDRLPEGSRFYRSMHGTTLVLYTPTTPERARAALEGRLLKMEDDPAALRVMEEYALRVAPEGTDLDRAGATWARVSAPPLTGQVWCDPATGEVIYFARRQ